MRELGCFVEIVNHVARAFVSDVHVLSVVMRSYPAQKVPPAE